MEGQETAARRFYAIYRPMAKRHNLRVHSRFQMQQDGLIEVFDGRGRQIVRAKEKTDEDCYIRAMEALISWENSRKEAG